MLTSLLSHLRRVRPGHSAISYILSALSEKYGLEFCIFADCGAAVGHTALIYKNIQTLSLNQESRDRSRIFCYEPLPENLSELRGRVSSDSSIIVRPYAVSNVCGSMSFCIPRRLSGESTHWGQGTSPVGFLGQFEGMETIKVESVTLSSENIERFDFVKLDLQGGEKAALQGLGEKLVAVKLLYVEHQLLSPKAESPLEYLLDRNFICFFDKLQIGVTADTKDIPLPLLSKLGIRVETIYPPDLRGISDSYMLFGSFDASIGATEIVPGFWSDDIVAELRAAGVYYLQTDIISFAPMAYNQFIRSYS
jgi:FkbM family methyltransferase